MRVRQDWVEVDMELPSNGGGAVHGVDRYHRAPLPASEEACASFAFLA